MKWTTKATFAEFRIAFLHRARDKPSMADIYSKKTALRYYVITTFK